MAALAAHSLPHSYWEAAIVIPMTQDQFRQLDDHYYYLGRFSAQFATAEVALFDLLVDMSGIDPRLGPAVFSSMRIDGCIAAIRKISQALEVPLDLALDKSLLQLKAISEVRNALFHYGTSHELDEPNPRPTSRAGNAPDARQFDVSLDALNAMTMDITDIAVLLLGYRRRDTEPGMLEDPAFWSMTATCSTA